MIIWKYQDETQLQVCNECTRLLKELPYVWLSLFIRRGTEEVRVTQIVSGSDFRVVLAPAISVEKYVAVDRSTVSERIQVCGWSLEFNVVTDVDCFLNKEQVY